MNLKYGILSLFFVANIFAMEPAPRWYDSTPQGVLPKELNNELSKFATSTLDHANAAISFWLLKQQEYDHATQPPIKLPSECQNCRNLLAFNGKLFILGLNDNTAAIVNAEDGKLIHILPVHGAKWYGYARFTHKGDKVATIEGNLHHTDYDIRVWDVSSGQCLFHKQGNDILQVIITKDDAKIIVRSADMLSIWDLDNGDHLYDISLPAWIIKCNASSNKLAIIAENNQLILLDLLSGAIKEYDQDVQDICFDKTGNKLAARARNQCIKIWDVNSERQLQMIPISFSEIPHAVPSSSRICSIRFMLDNNQIVVVKRIDTKAIISSNYSSISFYDVSTGTCIHNKIFKDNIIFPFKIHSFSSAPEMLISKNGNKYYIFDSKTAEYLTTWECPLNWSRPMRYKLSCGKVLSLDDDCYRIFSLNYKMQELKAQLTVDQLELLTHAYQQKNDGLPLNLAKNERLYKSFTSLPEWLQQTIARTIKVHLPNESTLDLPEQEQRSILPAIGRFLGDHYGKILFGAGIVGGWWLASKLDTDRIEIALENTEADLLAAYVRSLYNR